MWAPYPSQPDTLIRPTGSLDHSHLSFGNSFEALQQSSALFTNMNIGSQGIAKGMVEAMKIVGIPNHDF